MTRYRIATGLVTLAALGCLALPAVAQELPRPYVSRALDAVLLPVDGAVISAFGLSAKDSGALVLATEPGGTADKAGILPGDVISNVRGTRVKDPVQLDSVVWYWILSGVFDFGWEIYRGGEYTYYEWVITEEEYWTEIDILSAASWTSWEYESWSYSAYYEEYSEVMIEEYSYSESWIEETVSSEEFVSEVETSYEESISEETTTEESMTEESVTEEATSEESMSEESMSEESVSEDDASEEVSQDEAAGEDMAEEEAVAEDDGSYDEGADDGSMDDGSYDEGGDDGGGDDGSYDDGGGDDGGGDDGGGEDYSAEE